MAAEVVEGEKPGTTRSKSEGLTYCIAQANTTQTTPILKFRKYSLAHRFIEKTTGCSAFVYRDPADSGIQVAVLIAPIVYVPTGKWARGTIALVSVTSRVGIDSLEEC